MTGKKTKLRYINILLDLTGPKTHDDIMSWCTNANSHFLRATPQELSNHLGKAKEITTIRDALQGHYSVSLFVSKNWCETNGLLLDPQTKNKLTRLYESNIYDIPDYLTSPEDYSKLIISLQYGLLYDWFEENHKELLENETEERQRRLIANIKKRRALSGKRLANEKYDFKMKMQKRANHFNKKVNGLLKKELSDLLQIEPSTVGQYISGSRSMRKELQTEFLRIAGYEQYTCFDELLENIIAKPFNNLDNPAT
jgi:hypothetical protein